MRPIRRIVVAVATLIIAIPTFAQTSDPEANRRIAVWGSSVANGIGDELGQGGYVGRLEALLEARGWDVVNLSHNGDNTITIAPRFDPGDSPQPDTDYLTAVDPDYVIIGLSLGNEGIAQCQLGQAHRCTTTMADAEKIFEQFASGLQGLIARTRAAGITPVVTLPYARSDFWEREYAFTRRMILLINSWDVPSVNMLGAVDDGQGRWARGLWADPWHPNAAGHTELSHAVVPTLFAALEAGKPLPGKADGSGFARVRSRIPSPFSFEVEDTMRSFTVTFKVRTASDGIVAAVSGETLDAGYSRFRRSYGDFGWDTESLELTPSARRFKATLAVDRGVLTYTSSSGSSVSAPLQASADWHYITLTHYVARGETLLYVDGVHAGEVAEHLQPERFVLGGPGKTGTRVRAARADYRDWMIHRGGMTSDEVEALHDGRLLQASLEIYAPLADNTSVGTANRAQSLAEIAIDPKVRFLSADRVPGP